MDSIIRNLFYGNINPDARCYKEDNNFKKAMDRLAKNEELLLKSLQGEQLAQFQQYTDAWSEVNATEIVELFTTGYRIGARLTVDALVKDDNIFTPIYE